MKKVLIIQTAFLGDVLLSLPLLNRVKAIYPGAQVTLLCRKGVGEIFRELQFADEVIELDKKNKINFKKMFQLLKAQSYDLLLCPHESYRSHFMSMKIPAKTKIGFKNIWNFFIFNKSIKRDLTLPDALRQLSLISSVDSGSKEAIAHYQATKNIPAIAQMGFKNSIKSYFKYEDVVKKFQIEDQGIFIAPGSVWNTKRWKKEGFVEVAQKLSRNNKVIFIGSPEERELCKEISREVDGSLNLAGKTSLLELLILLSRGKLLISNDSGAMHMGSVAELPTLAIFGPTVLDLGYQPWQEKAVVVENKELKCRPCGKHGHQKCPLGTHECMKSISAEIVLKNLPN
jgi:heptosyltransferase II